MPRKKKVKNTERIKNNEKENRNKKVVIEDAKFDNFRTTIIIKQSTIPGAGLGVFAVEDIPEGVRIRYKGSFVKKEPLDTTYTWALYEYREKNGKVRKDTHGYILGDEIGHIDSKRGTHWTRYVNCSDNGDSGNMHPVQEYKNVFYKTKRLIKAGEELFIWYGQEYYDYLMSEGPD